MEIAPSSWNYKPDVDKQSVRKVIYMICPETHEEETEAAGRKR